MISCIILTVENKHNQLVSDLLTPSATVVQDIAVVDKIVLNTCDSFIFH